MCSDFYKDVQADWLCLGMTREALAKENITLKFESPSPVGTTPALNAEQSGGQRFPHIYSGIPPSVVFEERVVHRSAADGSYLSIEGLVEGAKGDYSAATSMPKVALCAAAAALVASAALIISRR